MKLDKPFRDATKLSLDEWLKLLNSKDSESYAFTTYEFPTDSMRDEYLSSIQNRTEKEVIDLLRHFLITSGSLGKDEDSFMFLMNFLENDKATYEKLMEMEYYKRLQEGFLGNTPIWEGNTWIIDLLPNNPKLALEALNAYFIAHIQVLPDGRVNGLNDAMALIRAKFIQEPNSTILQTLDPYQFEHVVDSLFMEMGYSTVLTRRTYDGGVDIIATKNVAGSIEKVLVQCKHSKKNIGVEEARALLGVVFDNKANKGVIVSSMGFTPAAKNYQYSKPIELIGNKELQLLLNTYFGSKWPLHLDSIISEKETMEKIKEYLSKLKSSSSSNSQ